MLDVGVIPVAFMSLAFQVLGFIVYAMAIAVHWRGRRTKLIIRIVGLTLIVIGLSMANYVTYKVLIPRWIIQYQDMDGLQSGMETGKSISLLVRLALALPF